MPDISEIEDDYIPAIYRLNNIDDDIFNYNYEPKFGLNLAMPKISLGFHHFIHQSRGNMDVTQQFQGKKKVYNVFSKFEKNIDDYNEDLQNLASTYFKLNNKPNIICRAFFKLWEIYYLFDIIPLNKPNIVTAHLCEGPGSFIQATLLYRDMYSKKVSSNDKYYGVTLHNDNKSIPKIKRDFSAFYDKETPKRVHIHKTVTRRESDRSKYKDCGDITTLKTINNFSKNFDKKKADIVTADGGFEWYNESLQEQEIYALFVGQLLTAVNIQADGGHFVLKIYETFTTITAKLLYVLKSFYKEVYITKPLTSRKSNSEKYIVCTNFTRSKNHDKRIKILERLLTDMMTNKDFIIDIFQDFVLGEESEKLITDMNTYLSDRQFQSINQIITFINRQNYRGGEYIKRRKMQIEATKYWSSNLFPDIKEFNNKKKEMEKFKEDIIKYLS